MLVSRDKKLYFSQLFITKESWHYFVWYSSSFPLESFWWRVTWTVIVSLIQYKDRNKEGGESAHGREKGEKERKEHMRDLKLQVWG